jgi:hypothetical protein
MGLMDIENSDESTDEVADGIAYVSLSHKRRAFVRLGLALGIMVCAAELHLSAA